MQQACTSKLLKCADFIPQFQFRMTKKITLLAPILLASALFLLSALHSAQALSQTTPNRSSKNIEITHTDRAPIIDGDLSDAVWRTTARRDDFLQQSPIEYRTTSENTDVYLTYGKDALYIGFFVHDSKPSEITNHVLEQDGRLRDEDKVTAYIDPFNNQRGGYQFQLNANGVRSEGIYVSGTRASFDWEGIWNGASKIVDGGWTAEMEIPFKSISFDPNNSTWGVNFARHLQREQEVMAWYSLHGEVNPTSLGTFTGISGASQGIGLDVVPAVAGSYFKDHVENNSESQADPSVDIFYKITPQINLAVTLNTDFSATEADDNSLNLSEFRQFFEEKRAFFLNDFDAFKYGLSDLQLNGVASEDNALAFYSRRIGLSENGQPVDIDGGIKLSGRAGGTEFGTLVMQQQDHVVDNHGTLENIDATSVIVARVSQSVLAESKIGAIYTNGNPTENQDNSLIGLDFQYRDSDFVAGKSLDSILLYQQTDDPDHNDNQSSYSAVVSVKSNEGLAGGAQYFVVEKNYSPGLGFTQRKNAELYSTNLSYKWIFDSDFLQEVTTSLDSERWNDFDSGNLDSNELGWTVAAAQLRRGDELELQLVKRKDVVTGFGRNPSGDLGFDVPAGTYSQDMVLLRYEAPNYWNIGGELEIEHGDYFTGTSTRINPVVEWKASRHLRLSAGYDLTQYELPGARVYTREIELDLDIIFNSSVSLNSTIEYDNVRREMSFNNRLRWNFQPGQDLWIVFNQGRVDEDENNQFAVTDTNAAFKFRYTLRY